MKKGKMDAKRKRGRGPTIIRRACMLGREEKINTHARLYFGSVSKKKHIGRKKKKKSGRAVASSLGPKAGGRGWFSGPVKPTEIKRGGELRY